jgi:hypothetical protein
MRKRRRELDPLYAQEEMTYPALLLSILGAVGVVGLIAANLMASASP